MSKPTPPPLVAESDAKAKLERAAWAAGVTVEQLADLVFEAGVVPPKGDDGITKRYTLKDLGSRLWGTMQGTPKLERAAWFDGLAPVQKTAVIVVLRDEGFRTEVIARDLGIEPEIVMRTWNAYGSQLGAQVVGLRLDTIAGQLQLAAERAQEMAIKADDHKGYWAIERDRLKALQSIGIVDQAIRKVEVTHKLTDEQKQAVENLANLRDKQNKRKLELEELEHLDNQEDELPEDIIDDYDEDAD